MISTKEIVDKKVRIVDEVAQSTLTQIIIDCAIKVHSKLGKGFPGSIYQRALAIELDKTALTYIREQEWPVFYDSDLLIGKRRVDFVIENNVMVEIKANDGFESTHFSQLKNYIEAFHFKIGLLINFGKDSLDYKRFTNNKIEN